MFAQCPPLIFRSFKKGSIIQQAQYSKKISAKQSKELKLQEEKKKSSKEVSVSEGKYQLVILGCLCDPGYWLVSLLGIATNKRKGHRREGRGEWFRGQFILCAGNIIPLACSFHKETWHFFLILYKLLSSPSLTWWT